MPHSSFPYRAELGRKALHVLALVLPAGILLLGRPLAPVLLALVALVGVGLDVARQRVPTVRRLLLRVFRPLMRPEEVPPPGAPLVLNGAVWMSLGAALCAVLFAPVVAASALAMLMVGDAAAALVGRRFGRRRYPGSPKSIEGSVAFVVSAWLAATPFAMLGEPALPSLVVGCAALAAAVAEAAPVSLNDNVWVPLTAGLVLTLLT